VSVIWIIFSLISFIISKFYYSKLEKNLISVNSRRSQFFRYTKVIHFVLLYLMHVPWHAPTLGYIEKELEQNNLNNVESITSKTGIIGGFDLCH
jgi:hypothetical protein